jgi:hypothetical protein
VSNTSSPWKNGDLLNGTVVDLSNNSGLYGYFNKIYSSIISLTVQGPERPYNIVFYLTVHKKYECSLSAEIDKAIPIVYTLSNQIISIQSIMSANSNIPISI